MAAPRAAESSWRICRRYKIFFYFCFIALVIQLLLGYNFYRIHTSKMSQDTDTKVDIKNDSSLHQKMFANIPIVKRNVTVGVVRSLNNKGVTTLIDKDSLDCKVATAKEALSAISRAKSNECKKEIAHVACLNENKRLFPLKLTRTCTLKGNHTYGTFLGCFKDNQKDRDMTNHNIQLSSTNSPIVCLNICLNGGYQYAGVQYKEECWCGNIYGKYGSLPDTSCSAICPGNHSETCGGYNAQRIFSTGLPEKKRNPAGLIYSKDEVAGVTPVRIVFVLTVNGRAVRQVRRLIDTLYDPRHYFYIHVDSRSSYMYRELLPLEQLLPNVHLARERFATIWGGASLLQAHLTFIKDLLEMTDWTWDYYVNLSESDYPIKTVEQLTWFLSAHRGNNFLKSNGRETPIFIKKQGLTELFYECDNHLWRLGKRPLQEGILYDGGSDWIGLYRDFAEYSVTSQDSLLTGLKESYKYCLLPVESFFHTLLLNSKFCETIIDNNLHLTNWKRKQGCKCQHKNQVDWCGCSPNVFKSEDMDRLMNYKSKAVFFARKFEPVINQDIINNLDSTLGKDLNELPGLIHYWHNDFHYLDTRNRKSDLWLTFMHSLIRRTRNIMNSTHPKCALRNTQIIESHVLNVADNFYRFIVKFNASLPNRRTPVTFESQYSFRQHYKILNPVGPIGRLMTLEVGSDFDLKELVFRNYPKFLGPESDVRLRHVWRYGSQFSMSVAWVDPAGVVASYMDVAVGSEGVTDAHNPKLKLPLRPGVWTVKILYRLNICAEVKFLVLPFSILSGDSLTPKQVSAWHNGPVGLYSHTNYSDFEGKLRIENSKDLHELSVINGKKFGAHLEEWIDSLTMEFWSVQDACAVENLEGSCPPLDLCSDTTWSSMSPDPKTEFSPKVLKYARKVL